jgi:hypothetical protein
MPASAVAAGLRSALRVGATDPAVVAIEARRWADGYGDEPGAPRPRRATVTLARPLPAATRAPSLNGYDQLLTGDTNHTGRDASTGEVAS